MVRSLAPLLAAFLPFAAATGFANDATAPSTGDEATTYLMVKLGDEAASAELASDFLSEFAAWLGKHVPSLPEGNVRGRIANRGEDARRILEEDRPVLAFVPAGFYLGRLRDRAAGPPVAQVPRFGTSVERYYLLAHRDGPSSIDELAGKRVHGVGELDRAWLERVVFPKTHVPGEDFRLEQSKNLADDVFLMVEAAGEDLGEEEVVPDAILADEELRRFFEKDDLVWPELRVIWKSGPLPRDLVVPLGDTWDDAKREALANALFAMKDDPSGRELLELMGSEGITPVDTDVLREAAAKYDAAEAPAKDDRG